jgi:hypothetical protein
MVGSEFPSVGDMAFWANPICHCSIPLFFLLSLCTSITTKYVDCVYCYYNCCHYSHYEVLLQIPKTTTTTTWKHAYKYAVRASLYGIWTSRPEVRRSPNAGSPSIRGQGQGQGQDRGRGRGRGRGQGQGQLLPALLRFDLYYTCIITVL